MGKGFDINYGSSITTDTRFGVHEYNPDKDTYLLDGVLLEKQSETDSTITYTPLKQSSFEKIIRYNSGQEKHYSEKLISPNFLINKITYNKRQRKDYKNTGPKKYKRIYKSFKQSGIGFGDIF